MINVCITFDYELFLGDNYRSANEVLFQPSEKIKCVLSKLGATATFYADVCSAIRHSQFGLDQYCNDFNRQIVNLVKAGIDVQLHIHPNWLNANYSSGKWSLMKEYYRLHSFGFEAGKDNNARQIIKISKEYLENIIKLENKKYKCIAFRAGGFAIQPHQDIVKALVDEGIKIDSSIAIGAINWSKWHWFDFTNIKRYKNWWINSDRQLEDINGNKEGLYEVPIFSEENKYLKRVFGNKKHLQCGQENGSCIDLSDNEDPGKLVCLMKRIVKYRKTGEILSLDSMSAERIINNLENVYKKCRLNNKDYSLAIIGHPKIFDELRIRNFEKLVNYIIDNKEKYKLKNMTDIYEEL